MHPLWLLDFEMGPALSGVSDEAFVLTVSAWAAATGDDGVVILASERQPQLVSSFESYQIGRMPLLTVML